MREASEQRPGVSNRLVSDPADSNGKHYFDSGVLAYRRPQAKVEGPGWPEAVERSAGEDQLQRPVGLEPFNSAFQVGGNPREWKVKSGCGPGG